jgi:putative hemolysin
VAILTRPSLSKSTSLPHLPLAARSQEELIRGCSYRVLLASTEEERSAIFRLRFQVFNLELNEGLDAAFVTGEDRDKFDDVCTLLYVQHQETGEVVGTYRVQSGKTAAENFGYYSEQEFKFGVFEPMRAKVLELGRACIACDHRSFEVLNILWRGLSVYAQQIGARYLLGCSSLTSQNPAEGWGVYERLRNSLAEPELLTVPQPEFFLPPAPPSADARVPRLLRAYLAAGASICGTPALDREFKTIDFLTLLDFQRISPAAKARFLR